MGIEIIAERDYANVLNVYSRLKSIDYSTINKRIDKELDYVAGLKDETLKFLGMALYSNEALAPSKKIDEYWHEMILNTPFYKKISDNMGGFVHHTPSNEPEVEAYKKTLTIYGKIFGVPNKEFWVGKAGDCKAGGCNGRCASYCTDGDCQASCRN